MTTDQIKRKLAAILSADVKGYSRLMGEDEEWTLRTLNNYKEVISDFIQQHQGRIVGGAGDSILAEFASVVEAVQSAVEIQQVLKAKNALLPENRRMDFRIGINLGDVIEEEDSIYGDGVNIAARLEALAEPGGICISGTAYDHIENKIPLQYDFLGEHEVKNIARPVRVYRAIIESEAASSKPSMIKKTAWKQLSKWAIGMIAVVGIGGGAVLYQFVIRSSSTKTDVASKEKMAFPLPDKPSIAVLPFTNLSGDPKHDFFSDGITEDIITALSKVPRLFVVARNSTFTYKGKPVKVKQVSEDLGVRYVLEGSVQKSGDRVRITAQLIDALAGNHLWAERYDRELKDIFVLQDEITLKVLTSVREKLTLGSEGWRSQKYAEKYYKGKQGLDCYLKVMEGLDYLHRRTIEDTDAARHIAEETLRKCPEIPTAYNLMGQVYSRDYWLGTNPQESIEKGIAMAQKALALDDTLAEAHSLLGSLYTQKREYDKGIAEGERALAFNPGGAELLVNYAASLNFAGRSEEAIPLLEKAIRLNPSGLSGGWYSTLGNAFLFTGRYEEAVSAYKKAIQVSPNYPWSHLQLAATYSLMGREKEARSEAAEVLRINPKFSLAYWSRTALVRDQSIRNKIFEALHKAGLK
jgi:adenylate cyclase